MSNISKKDIVSALPEYYLPYAQYVNQTRALPDSRDGLKQGARFILYAQYLNKLTYDKKPRKAVATVSAGMEFSVHGDSSILGTAVRMSQPFSLRYPLIEVKGNNGSQVYGSDVYSQARYLEMFSNKIAGEMFSLLGKETIDKWELNYTQDKEYPTVLPSLFPNFINGCTGIGVALATSIPQFNLKEICASAIYLLDNPNATFEELYCPIDFATGGIIINEQEVKKSLTNGTGKAAIVRAKIEYDHKNRELVVVELPYQVTSSNVVAQIQKCIDENKIVGIEAVFDGSDIDGVKICIKLTKTASPEKIIKLLYKETSLQYHYGINMMMLDQGKTPKIYSFPLILDSYLSHAKDILYKSYQYDLKEAQDRLEILEGYLKALANINEIVEIIKKSSSKEEAIKLLMSQFNFTEKQTKAVLELKLQRLVNLEAIKIQKEYDEISEKVKYLNFILLNQKEFINCLKKEINRISLEYGDTRRTTNITLGQNDNEEVIEEKNLIVYFTNYGNLYADETTTLMAQRKGGRGNKIKLEKGEVIIKTINGKNNSSLLIFTNSGRAYSLQFDSLIDNPNIHTLLELNSNETVVQVVSDNNKKEYIIFLTKNGLIKKSKANLYNITKKGITAIKLTEDDLIIKILFVDDENIGILTHDGIFKIIESIPITATGRVSQGVIAIKLEDNDYIVDAQPIKNIEQEIISLSEEGLCAKISLKEFSITGRPAKGKLLQKGKMVGFVLVDIFNKEIAIISSQNIIKIPISSIILTNRGVVGTRAINLKDDKIIGVLKEI